MCTILRAPQPGRGSPAGALRPLTARGGVCEHEGDRMPRRKTRRARNESAAPAVDTVGKQSPYNPGEM
ncbi:hypothetical protein TPA0905_56140 [Streptomyces olivaceus]|nr:hypothetical protein TPA0905_56140 [Streptomyces olivaceus]